METEIWKKTDECQNYSVSNLGNVRNDKTGRTLKLTKDKYYYVISMSINGKPKKCLVHHLVACAFLGVRPEGCYILHGDRGQLCNEVSNLRYGTPKENSTEMVQRDNNGCNQKFTMEQVKEIRDLFNNHGLT